MFFLLAENKCNPRTTRLEAISKSLLEPSITRRPGDAVSRSKGIAPQSRVFHARTTRVTRTQTLGSDWHGPCLAE
jgi:hypothetical protein